MEDPYAEDSSLPPLWNANVQDDGQSSVNLNQHQQHSIDYYALLNVPRDATEEQIKISYRKLCRMYHPDKQTETGNKDAAEKRFHKINRAYEVLIDPSKRTVYDMYGPDAAGLVTDRQVGPLLKTPDQIREEYEEKIRIDNMKKLDSLILQKGEITINVDAKPLISRLQGSSHNENMSPTEMSKRSLASVSAFNLKYSNETPFSNGGVILTGKMLSRGTNGHGNVVGTLRYRIPVTGTYTEFQYTLLQPHVFSTRISHPLEDVYDSVVTLNSSATTLAQPPTFNLSFQRLLVKNKPHIGFIRFYSGEYRIGGWGKGDLAMQIKEGIERQTRGGKPLTVKAQNVLSNGVIGVRLGGEQKSLQISAQVSLMSTALAVTHEHRLSAMTFLKLSCVLDLRSHIVSLAWSLRQSLSEHLAVEVGLSTGVNGVGSTFTLSVERLGQRLHLPILLTTESDLYIAASTTLACVAAGGALQRLVFEPRRKRALKMRIQELRELNRAALEENRRDARDALRLILPAVIKKVEAEQARNGFVVLEALYGKLKECEQQHKELRVDEQYCVIDVSIAVMALVEDGALRISSGSSKAFLNGFYDPCFGEEKQLQITYLFKGKNHRVRVGDTSSVAAPIRCT